ncbi:MAG: putative lipid II flippase FtsW [Polyangiaceae bacterium]|nr:putative lipid II flippase FtsW [Polyangiaceae bacterium]
MKEFFRSLFARGPKVGAVDPALAAPVIALLGFGVVMVYSAGVIEAGADFGNPHHFVKRQGVFALLALGTMFAVSRFDYHKLRLLTYLTLGTVAALMLATVVGLGHTSGGATRWIRLGPVNLQPSEFAKVAMVLWLAYSLDKKREKVKSFSIGMVPHLLMAGLLVLICMKQPDFGSAAVLLFLTFSMLFVAGARVVYLLGAGAIGLSFAFWAIRFTAYRWERMLAWFNMIEHRQDLAYQPFQAVMSFGSGQLTGMGLGQGKQVLYLPEAHTDSISAIIGEELGFIGIFCLCLVYLFIVARGVKTALSAEDEYGSYVAFGLSMLFGVQALVNLAVAMAILPTKGLTLPFISYGGSSLVVNAAAMGILLNVSRPRKERVASRARGTVEASAIVGLSATDQLDQTGTRVAAS